MLFIETSAMDPSKLNVEVALKISWCEIELNRLFVCVVSESKNMLFIETSAMDPSNLNVDVAFTTLLTGIIHCNLLTHLASVRSERLT